MRLRHRVKIYFDGGCRPNPGPMETAIVVRGQAHIECDLGLGTAMDAEWQALIAALHAGFAHGEGRFVLLGDALAVINQANGAARCPAANVPHLAIVRALCGERERPPIRHIKRSQNLAGIALSRRHPR